MGFDLNFTNSSWEELTGGYPTVALFRLQSRGGAESDILGQNSTFFRGTLEKLTSEGSFGGPMMAVFNQSPEEKGGVLSLYTGFARFPHHFS